MRFQNRAEGDTERFLIETSITKQEHNYFFISKKTSKVLTCLPSGEPRCVNFVRQPAAEWTVIMDTSEEDAKKTQQQATLTAAEPHRINVQQQVQTQNQLAQSAGARRSSQQIQINPINVQQQVQTQNQLAQSAGARGSSQQIQINPILVMKCFHCMGVFGVPPGYPGTIIAVQCSYCRAPQKFTYPWAPAQAQPTTQAPVQTQDSKVATATSSSAIPTDHTIYLGGRGGSANNLQCSNAGTGEVRCANKNKEPWEVARLKHVGNSEYVITSERNHNNLQCKPNGGEQLWERWTIEVKKGLYYFVSEHTQKTLQYTAARPAGCDY